MPRINLCYHRSVSRDTESSQRQRHYQQRTGHNSLSPLLDGNQGDQGSPEPGEGEVEGGDVPDNEWMSGKKQEPDPYGLVAREITRIVDMYWEPRQVITAGAYLLSLDSQDDVEAEIASASGSKQKTYNICEILLKKLPDFEEKLRAGEESWKEMRRRLDHGKAAARTEDNFTVKRWVPAWFPWQPQLNRLKKSDRGLAHEQCAMLLRPATTDWGNENVRHQFRAEHNPPMTADVWPALCYENGVVDLNNLETGLLYSNLMIQCGRALLYPPSVANAQDPNDTKSNRESKASKYDMESVTTGFLAYVGVVLRYTLSSEDTFMESSGTFNYVVFYNDLVSYLEAPEFQDQTHRLIAWWNERIFPPKQTHLPNNPGSMLARLRQQREQGATPADVPGEQG